MTAQEKLHAVETAIRKALPRLMEPTEGCFFQTKYGIEKLISVLGTEKNTYLFQDPFKNIYTLESIPTIYQVIGHDILLSDVLEWITLFNDFCLWQGMILKPVGSSNYYAEFETINEESFDKSTIVLDLSKPRLADQSEELINFLYNLIKEN